MNISRLLLGFRGRISRGQFWTGLAMWAPIGLPAFALYTILDLGSNPGWNRGFRIDYYSPHGLAPFLVFFIPVVAISVKRLHDRGRSGWWSLPLIVAPILILFFATPPWHRGDGWSTDQRWDHLVWSPPALWITLLALAALILIAWAIELGMRHGTPGPNRYGPAEYKAIGSAGEDASAQEPAGGQRD